MSLVFFLALQYDFDRFHYLTRSLALSMLAVKLRYCWMWSRSISFAPTHTGQIEEACIPVLFRWRCTQSRAVIWWKLAAKTLLGRIDGILFSGIVSQTLSFTSVYGHLIHLLLGILQLPVGRWTALQEIANGMHLWLGCRPCHCGVSHIGSGSSERLSPNPLWLTGWLPPSLLTADYSVGLEVHANVLGWTVAFRNHPRSVSRRHRLGKLAVQFCRPTRQ